MATPYKQLVYEPDYGDEAVDVGPQFNEFAAGPSQPSSITQPAAPGPSVIPQTGGPGTITYGETVVKPEKVTQQPLPWWYQDYLNKEQATVDREKAAQREADARYWAEQEFKKRVGNLVPRSMAEAVAASKEMSKIEGQLGMQYDIRAGVPVEQALAKWGGKIWSDKMPITGRQLAGSQPAFNPRIMDVQGVRIAQLGPNNYQIVRETPDTSQLGKVVSTTSPEGTVVNAVRVGPQSVRILPGESETRSVNRAVLKKDAQGNMVQYGTERVTQRQNQIRNLEEKRDELLASKEKARASKQPEIDQQLKTVEESIRKLEQAKFVTNQSQYDALASGDVYISKDGSVRIKP